MTAFSPTIQAVLDVFQGALAEVRFADIDAGALARLAADVEATCRELESEETKVAQLRQALHLQQEALLAQATRALAYARVYAEADPVLSERLNAIPLARPIKRLKHGAAPGRGSQDGEHASAVEPTGVLTAGAEEPSTAPQRELFQRRARRRDPAPRVSDDTSGTESTVGA